MGWGGGVPRGMMMRRRRVLDHAARPWRQPPVLDPEVAWMVREDVLEHHPHRRTVVAAATRTLCSVEWLTTV